MSHRITRSTGRAVEVELELGPGDIATVSHEQQGSWEAATATSPTSILFVECRRDVMVFRNAGSAPARALFVVRFRAAA